MKANPVTVLVVDDDPAQTMLFRRILERQGYRICTAPNGVEALKVLEVEAVNLVITDRMMPVMDGMDLTAAIRRDKRFAQIPVIMVTASADDETMELGMRTGAALTLEKPVDSEKLINLVGFAVS